MTLVILQIVEWRFFSFHLLLNLILSTRLGGG